MKEIANQIYYVGVNDRQKTLFENMWPLPYGVSYNAYLIVDEKTVLIDTVDVCYSDLFLKKVAEALQGRTLDYLIVNHRIDKRRSHSTVGQRILIFRITSANQIIVRCP